MMMSHTLSQIFGLYLVAVALAMVMHKDRFYAAAEEILKSKGLMLFAAIITLMMGIVLITIHNIWLYSWPMVITIICWVVFVSGLMRLLMPELIQNWGMKMLKHKGCWNVSALCSGALGLYLLYMGFFA